MGDYTGGGGYVLMTQMIDALALSGFRVVQTSGSSFVVQDTIPDDTATLNELVTFTMSLPEDNGDDDNEDEG